MNAMDFVAQNASDWMRVTLVTLREDFGVDTAPAAGLEGAALLSWIHKPCCKSAMRRSNRSSSALGGRGAPCVAEVRGAQRGAHSIPDGNHGDNNR